MVKVALTLILLSQAQALVRPEPPTQVALTVAEKIGAHIKHIELVLQETLALEEREELTRTFERAGLFVLSTREQAQATVEVRRLDTASVLVSGRSPSGERLFAASVPWPSEPAAASSAGSDAEARYERVLELRRRRLELRPVTHSYVGPLPILFSDALDSAGGARGLAAAPPYTGPLVVNLPDDFLIVRGAAEVLDDVDLARLLGDPRLEERIIEARFWPKLYWGLGFGAVAAGAVTTGALLRGAQSDDSRTAGLSLLVVGGACAVMAALAPTIVARHVLGPSEAEELVHTYNVRLRRELGIRAEDLARYQAVP